MLNKTLKQKSNPGTERLPHLHPNSPGPDSPDNTDRGDDDGDEDAAEDDGADHPSFQPVTLRVVRGALAGIAVDEVDTHVGVDAAVSEAVIHVAVAVQALEAH